MLIQSVQRVALSHIFYGKILAPGHQIQHVLQNCTHKANDDSDRPGLTDLLSLVYLLQVQLVVFLELGYSN